jgi:hypothetical protein
MTKRGLLGLLMLRDALSVVALIPQFGEKSIQIVVFMPSVNVGISGITKNQLAAVAVTTLLLQLKGAAGAVEWRF